MGQRKYRKYSWVGNKISEEDMSKLYGMKEEKGTPITELVANAVKKFVNEGT